MTPLRICRGCGLVNAPRFAFCTLCGCETRAFESPKEAPMHVPPAVNRISTVSGALPLLVALMAVLLGAMALRTCDVDDEPDEHAAPACVGRCS